MFALIISMTADKLVPSRQRVLAVAAVVVPFLVANCLLYLLVYANALHLPARFAAEQPAYGLRFVDAFIPSNGITAGFLKPYYDTIAPLNEGSYAYIGYLATAGLLISFASLMRRVSPKHPGSSALDDDFLAIFAVCALCLVVTCLPFGAGLLVNMISPFIRAQNRFSIFLTFWGVLCFAIFFTRLSRGWARIVWFVVLIGLTSKELSERVNFLARSHCPAVCSNGRSCICFDEVKRSVEPVLDAMKSNGVTTVLQLPFQKYPEAGPSGVRSDYFGFLPYVVVSKDSPLRFSYGLTDDDLLGANLAASQESLRLGNNVEKTIRQLACVGYQGILIDKLAYATSDLDAVERSLRSLHRDISIGAYSLYTIPNPSTALLSDVRSERIKQSVSCFEGN
jgi:hypothetical protein